MNRIAYFALVVLGLMTGFGACTKDEQGNIVFVTVDSISPATGPTAGGTLITVTGTNFPATSQIATVKFGTVTALVFNVLSPTSAEVTTPPHAAGAVSVTVVMVTGDSATAPNAFTYADPVAPPPSLTNVNPTSGPTGGGTAIALTGAAFQVGATVTVGGAAATGVTVTSAIRIDASTPPGTAGAKSIVVQNPDGLADTLTNAFTYTPPVPADTSEPVFRAGIDSVITFDGFDNYATTSARHAARFTGPTSGGHTKGFVAINDPEDSTRYLQVTGRGGSGFALQARYPLTGTMQQRVSWATNRTPVSPGSNATVVIQFYIRIQAGWSPGVGGLKWMELWPNGGSAGERLQITVYQGTNANPDFGVGYNVMVSTGNYGVQPASSAHWSQFNDGTFYRHTFMFKPAAVFGDQTGIVRYWINGQKIVDVSASSGIATGYCTAAEVGFIMAKQVGYIQFPDVGLSPGWAGPGTVDFDDFLWFVRK